MNPGRWRNSAFSLIEVVIAIGIFAFVICGVVGLIPSGMKAFRNSNQQSGAANLINALADSIRTAGTGNGSNFFWVFNGTTNNFTIAGSTVTNRWEGTNSLTIQGRAAAASLDQQLLAVVTVTPPSASGNEGYALISVAWPAASRAVWNGATKQWSRAEGSATLGIRFLPRLPLSLP